MGFSNEDKILIKNLHDSAWNSLWDFFNNTSSTAYELTVLILSLSVSDARGFLPVKKPLYFLPVFLPVNLPVFFYR